MSGAKLQWAPAALLALREHFGEGGEQQGDGGQPLLCHRITNLAPAREVAEAFIDVHHRSPMKWYANLNQKAPVRRMSAQSSQHDSLTARSRCAW